MTPDTPHVVVIGGGTGAPVSIRALLALGYRVSAVVAMADDGGSSGVLREQAGIVPPGDIRKCLVSMADDSRQTWARAFERRLPSTQDHPLGNLILTTLADVTGSLPEAIHMAGELLNIRGRVYPSTLQCIELIGQTVDGQQLQGQAVLTRSTNTLADVSLNPTDPKANDEAIAAILSADLVVLGPGSLFTSIIPNLLVPEVLAALEQSPAVKVFVCSLADMQGETRAMSALDHVQTLLRHGMDGLLDIALINEPVPQPEHLMHIQQVKIDPESLDVIRAHGVRPELRRLVDPLRPTWHDIDALSAFFEEVWQSVVYS